MQENTLSNFVIAELEHGHTREEIEAQLIAKGNEERFVKELVKAAITLRDSKRRTVGLALIMSGAAVCLFSFLFSVLNFSQGSFSFALYGLTTIGIIVAFAGFTKVF